MTAAVIRLKRMFLGIGRLGLFERDAGSKRILNGDRESRAVGEQVWL